jgi:uncharacterized protein with ParB-like and HNH nuclease domain
MEKNESIELDIEDIIEDEEVYQTFDIATYPSDFTLKGIVNMWNEGGITIPDFQREFVWSIKQSSLLIESFLLGLPVPPVFFYIDEENSNLVIDGQQRVLSVVYFFNGFFGLENTTGRKQVFRLSGLNEKSPYHKKTYSELTESDKRKLDNTVLRAINIRQLTPTGESTSMYHIFERLNTGGTPLKSQEIRNVVFRGEFVSILRELNEDENWRLILGRKALNKHQTDVELLLRVFALYTRLDEYEKPMKEFLNISMKRNQDGNTKEVKDFSKKFILTTDFLIKNLGEKPFHLRTRLSTSTLDSVIIGLMNNLNRIPDNFNDRFNELKKSQKLEELTTIGTTDPKIVRERFEFINQVLFN